jgi:hypothetical protein
MERANNAMLTITEFKDRCDWLEPPSMTGTLSVLEVFGFVNRDWPTFDHPIWSTPR